MEGVHILRLTKASLVSMCHLPPSKKVFMRPFHPTGRNQHSQSLSIPSLSSLVWGLIVLASEVLSRESYSTNFSPHFEQNFVDLQDGTRRMPQLGHRSVKRLAIPERNAIPKSASGTSSNLFAGCSPFGAIMASTIRQQNITTKREIEILFLFLYCSWVVAI